MTEGDARRRLAAQMGATTNANDAARPWVGRAPCGLWWEWCDGDDCSYELRFPLAPGVTAHLATADWVPSTRRVFVDIFWASDLVRIDAPEAEDMPIAAVNALLRRLDVLLPGEEPEVKNAE